MTGRTASATGRDPVVAARDAELLRAAAAGDAAAFEQLLRPRIDRMYRMAYAITRREQDARDATQDASVLAWRELPRLRDHAKFDAWLSQVLVNAARGTVRRSGRDRVREISIDGANAPEAPQSGRVEPSVPGDADNVAEREVIRRAFERVDGATRALLVLHYVEGIPVAEIARTTASPVGTVKWRLSNARRALERALEVEQR